jgi:hypothetical protein
MPSQSDLTAVFEFLGTTCKVLPEPVDDFAPILEEFGRDLAWLIDAGDLLTRTSYPGCAVSCFKKAISLDPNSYIARARLAISLLALRRIKDAMDTISQQVSAYRVIVYSVFDRLCNEALWLGRHDLVAEFIAANTIVLASAAQSDSEGYFVDAILSYACEADPTLFEALCDLYQRATGKPYAYRDQSCLPGNSEDHEFLFASHGFAGTSALINFLLLIGVRVDEIGRRWNKAYALNEGTEIRSYCSPPIDELPARVLRRYFPFQRHVRCYSFSHRLPNPAQFAGRPSLFLVRDPRVSFTTGGKPTGRHIESGAFARFVAVHAQDWCDFVDGMERMENKLIIRFEDWQADPYAVADKVIRQFDLKVRHGEMEEAIFFSSTDVSRRLRVINHEIQGSEGNLLGNVDDPRASPEMLHREYELIEKICGERMTKLGYVISG